MITSLQVVAFEQVGPRKDEHSRARKVAGKSFDRAFGRGIRSQWWAKMIGKENGLQTLSHQTNISRRKIGTVVVPLSKIVGSEGRSEDFDKEFNPLKYHNRERWINIATARQIGIALPAVELVRNGDEYYVRDGHHRISVAKVMGQVEIDARIVN